ncbi:DUF1049 domain-containing protein [Kitasatospora sp. LaBMicrA B282]|uniref:DUF1049 domain-containing protein n=1 Tax=Kitasatospora sp. LaBMicrA B282 TaxID=3420949 RepID=UPI003D0A4833
MTERSTGTRDGTDRDTGGWWRSRWFVPGVLVALAVVFIAENRGSVRIRVIVPLVTMPLWAALLGVWLVGVVTGLFVSYRRRRNARRATK